ncbi:hypothetical protein [Desulfopila sp. IMCC35008]|uniref:hypothetical protein n=1 Tax=Desulfopila sp. IMCC35008 TaxID=2653858 RepID=UPI00197AEDEF|nr:hypothetical protein [Desulfopila sp. IMCC35008]
MYWKIYLLVLTVCVFMFGEKSLATDFHIGPGQSHEAIGDVAWESLEAGDRVYIHWRSEPYYEKWVIGVSGTAESPILVSGVAGPQGQLPVIDGRNATTRQALSYWNENRGLLKIGGSSTPGVEIPSHIIIENLDLRSARPPYTFTDDSGQPGSYVNNAASFYVEIGQHLTIRNCILHDSGNGIFIGVNEGRTQDILIEGNYIYDNGIEGRYYEHNTYTSAIGITYQYNYMGGLRSGADGNNLKDRSAGLVVRYNWIENGNRQLDLVDGEDSEVVVNDPSYRTTHVYGNILKEAEDEGNRQMIHYGGDSGTLADYRKGTLYLYNNTIISTRSDRNTLLRLSTNDESAQVFNNIIYTPEPASSLSLLDSSGHLTLRNNWLKPGWYNSYDGGYSGTVDDDGSNIEGSDPGFVDYGAQDYHLSAASVVLDQGLPLLPELVNNYRLFFQYVKQRQSEPRADDGSLDIGAFERVHDVTGDINGSGAVDLGDVVLSLRILAGDQDQVTLNAGTDVGGDGKITIEEALFCLRSLAKMP